MDKKIIAFAKATRAVFQEDELDPLILVNDQMPHGYLTRIREILPSSFSWPRENAGLSRYYLANKQVILKTLRSDSSESNTLVSDNIPQHSEREKAISSEHRGYISESDIVKLINEVLDKRILDVKNAVQIEINKHESPPLPKTTKGQGQGRKENRKYAMITPTIDIVLRDLFIKETKKRNISQGKLMDQILWHWFQKPKLSYDDD